MRQINLFILLATVIFLQVGCKKENPTNMTPNPPISETSEILYLALGDSYTIGQSVEEAERWPIQLAKNLQLVGIEVADPQLIAKTGWTTANLKDAIDEAELENNFDLVSLLIGVNNQYQGKSIEQYKVEFEELLITAVKLAKDNKKRVFVVSIPDYGATPFGAANAAAIGSEIDAFNVINKQITDKYSIQYFDITPISRQAKDNPALTAKDGLHPSGEMYRLWVELILEEVKGMLAK
ncbi:MAG: SGNH/GDSL hydrolase family protein [Chitinophagales bacterium]